MKKLLIFLFSFFLLSSTSIFADDISDFEIEGMSIGDSLLDYMTEDEIFKEIERTKNWYSHLEEPNKYVEVFLFKDLPVYDMVSFKLQSISSSKYVTNKNEKYTILNLRGMKDYIEDFDACIQKRDEVVADLSQVFLNAQKTKRVQNYPGDSSGNSIVDGIYFNFNLGGSAGVACTNIEENYRINNKWSEGLEVSINSAEIVEWLNDVK